MAAKWMPIPGYPEYEISDEGEIYHKNTDLILSASPGTGGDYRVNLWNGVMYVTRIVKNLVGKAFLEQPIYESMDTVMQKDGDKSNCHVHNLCWRPRWYVMQYTQQFRLDDEIVQTQFRNTPHVWNATRGILYQNVHDAGLNDGILWEQVKEACKFHEPCMVTGYLYEFVG